MKPPRLTRTLALITAAALVGCGSGDPGTSGAAGASGSAGAGAGGATGGILGALIGAGIPKERAEAYDRGLKSGGIVLGTRARDEKHAAELERDFGQYGGTDVMR